MYQLINSYFFKLSENFIEKTQVRKSFLVRNYDIRVLIF